MALPRLRSGAVAAVGLGGLLVLIVLSVASSSSRASRIYAQIGALQAHHHEVEGALRRLRSDVHLSGIFIRDYLIEQEGERASAYRDGLVQFRASSREALEHLKALLSDTPATSPTLASLEQALDQYWQAFEPVVGWRAQDKATRSAAFLRSQVIPRREAALNVARSVEQLNHASVAEERAQIDREFAAFQRASTRGLWMTLLLGLLLAAGTIWRLDTLERSAADGRQAALDAEARMRQLSLQIVATQEEERRKLSRELHDHLGQMLAALRLELGRIERLRMPANVAVANVVSESRALVDDLVRAVRDLAMGLRPSMLDDLGLTSALAWLGRDFTRRFNIPVTLDLSPKLDQLPDQYRTAIYRIVQEALTNCARHSGATRVSVSAEAGADVLRMTIADNGVGLDDRARAEGLGLRGMEERVRELDGQFMVSSIGRGTTVTVTLPVPGLSREDALATAAG